jgi:hypothetical protein
VAHDDHVALRRPRPGAVGGKELLTGQNDPGVDLGQRLTAHRAEVRALPPGAPHIGRDVAQGLALVLAVVDLDPALVDRDGKPEIEEGRRVLGSP